MVLDPSGGRNCEETRESLVIPNSWLLDWLMWSRVSDSCDEDDAAGEKTGISPAF